MTEIKSISFQLKFFALCPVTVSLGKSFKSLLSTGRQLEGLPRAFSLPEQPQISQCIFIEEVLQPIFVASSGLAPAGPVLEIPELDTGPTCKGFLSFSVCLQPFAGHSSEVASARLRQRGRSEQSWAGILQPARSCLVCCPAPCVHVLLRVVQNYRASVSFPFPSRYHFLAFQASRFGFAARFLTHNKSVTLPSCLACNPATTGHWLCAFRQLQQRTCLVRTEQRATPTKNPSARLGSLSAQAQMKPSPPLVPAATAAWRRAGPDCAGERKAPGRVSRCPGAIRGKSLGGSNPGRDEEGGGAVAAAPGRSLFRPRSCPFPGPSPGAPRGRAVPGVSARGGARRCRGPSRDPLCAEREPGGGAAACVGACRCMYVRMCVRVCMCVCAVCCPSGPPRHLLLGF